MNRRKKEVERRTTNVGVPKAAIKNTVGLIVRIHGGRHASDAIKSEMKFFKLSRKYDAVFVKLDDKMIGIAYKQQLMNDTDLFVYFSSSQTLRYLYCIRLRKLSIRLRTHPSSYIH